MKTPAHTQNSLFRQRTLWLAIGGISLAASLGAALAAPAGTGRAPAATAPAKQPGVSPANKAAAEAQFDKANALYLQGKYKEAKAENDRALQLDPTNFNAVLMQSTLKRYVGEGGVMIPLTTQPPPVAQGKIPVLTTQQMSLVRLMEMNPNEPRVTGKIDPKVLEDFWQNVVLKGQGDKTKAAHDAFINPGNITGQVARIRDSNDFKYLEQITLTSDPATYTNYRTHVQNFVMQSCATPDCHGGDKAPGGNFRLINPATTAEQQYTNFYILLQYSSKDGNMVDRGNPEKSLLTQYGLPWNAAAVKHPKVEARKFTGPTDQRRRTILEWVGTLAPIKPNYGFVYDMPGMTTPVLTPVVPTSGPATR